MTTSGLQVDGLYVEDTFEPMASGEASRAYLRFYADGTVVSAAVTASATATLVWQWLRREDEELDRGIVMLDGRVIRFETRGGFPDEVIIDHAGTWTPTELVLTTTSRWNGHVAQRRFTFAPMQPEAPAKPKRRAKR